MNAEEYKQGVIDAHVKHQAELDRADDILKGARGRAGEEYNRAEDLAMKEHRELQSIATDNYLEKVMELEIALISSMARKGE